MLRVIPLADEGWLLTTFVSDNLGRRHTHRRTTASRARVGTRNRRPLRAAYESLVECERVRGHSAIYSLAMTSLTLEHHSRAHVYTYLLYTASAVGQPSPKWRHVLYPQPYNSAVSNKSTLTSWRDWKAALAPSTAKCAPRSAISTHTHTQSNTADTDTNRRCWSRTHMT